MAATTSAGSGGGGVSDALSQPESFASQSRTYCLSKLGSDSPGTHAAASQNRDESGVSTSSASTSVPSLRRPNSNFVSARMMPRAAAISRARA